MTKEEFKILIFMILVCIFVTILVNTACVKLIEYKYKDEMKKLELMNNYTNKMKSEWHEGMGARLE